MLVYDRRLLEAARSIGLAVSHPEPRARLRLFGPHHGIAPSDTPPH